MSTEFEAPHTVLLRRSGWRSVASGRAWFWTSAWSPTPDVIQDGSWTDQDLAVLPGHFAIVDLRGLRPKLTVDRQRSVPLLAVKDLNQDWIITDEIEALREHAPFRRNEDQAVLFKRFAHALGSSTLVEGVYSAEAASSMVLGTEAYSEAYLRFQNPEDAVTEIGQYTDLFSAALDSVTDRFLAQVGDRKLVVPLSAGHDSRIILTWLKRKGVENVHTFSYGRAGSIEPKRAAEVARMLGYSFEHVVLDEGRMKRWWDSSESREFVRSSWGGVSLPHVQDLGAIVDLVERDVLNDGTIILPGHTMPVLGVRADLMVSPNRHLVTERIAGQFGGLQRDWESLMVNPSFMSAVKQTLRDVDFGSSERSNQDAVQWFNLANRQAKYITNSLRTYDFFSIPWAMPLHEPEVWAARMAADPSMTLGRKAYKRFVEREYRRGAGLPEITEAPAAAAPTPAPTSTAPKTQIASIRRRLNSVVSGTGLGVHLNPVFRAVKGDWTPGAFEAYDGARNDLQKRLITARGGLRLGRWAELMVNSDWGYQTELYDR